jgi:hypothetical protein
MIDDDKIIEWLVRVERVRLAISQWRDKPVICARNAAFSSKQWVRFIFDSSHHLNCHSNFIPKIATLERHGSGEGDNLPALATGGR